MRDKLIPSDITLEKTCGACPEQYDAYYNNEIIGYLRLRHGYFSVEYPQCNGELIYEAYPNGDGIFETNERSYYLGQAIQAIITKRNNED